MSNDSDKGIPQDPGEAYEQGWRDACDDWLQQERDPRYPIGRRKQNVWRGMDLTPWARPQVAKSPGETVTCPDCYVEVLVGNMGGHRIWHEHITRCFDLLVEPPRKPFWAKR